MSKNFRRKRLAKLVCDIFGHEFRTIGIVNRNKKPSFQMAGYDRCDRCGRVKHDILGILPERG